MVLEGGYSLDGLWISTKEVLDVLLDKKLTDFEIGEVAAATELVADEEKKAHSEYWNF